MQHLFNDSKVNKDSIKAESLLDERFIHLFCPKKKFSVSLSFAQILVLLVVAVVDADCFTLVLRASDWLKFLL